jgi:hypothetical protein
MTQINLPTFRTPAKRASTPDLKITQGEADAVAAIFAKATSSTQVIVALHKRGWSPSQIAGVIKTADGSHNIPVNMVYNTLKRVGLR